MSAEPTLTLSTSEVQALRRAIDRLCGQIERETSERPKMVRDAGSDRTALAEALVKLGVHSDGTLRTPQWLPPNSEGPFNPIQIRRLNR